VKPQAFSGGATAHLPGWNLTIGARTYQVWAPRPEGYPFRDAGDAAFTSKARGEWAACYRDSGDEWAGDFRKGATADEVLGIFSPRIAAKFRAVIAEATLP
jgi:hypothetical protein